MIVRIIRLLAIAGYFTLLPILVLAQNQVSSIGIDQGLSNNSVRSIFQDHKGFMWFGTYDGLNRYDGYSFKTFRHKFGDTTSLINNHIFAIEEGIDSNLWVGTQGGVSVYNNLSGKFTSVYFKLPGNKHASKIEVGVRAIKADKKGNIFLGTLGLGLLVAKSNSNAVIQIPLMYAGKAIKDYDVQVIKTDYRNHLLLFVPLYGLCELDYQTMSLHVINGTYKHAFTIEPDGKDIWLGTNKGLYLYQSQKDTIIKIADKGAGGLTGNSIPGMALGDNNQLWLAVNGGGVNICNTITHKITYLTGQNGNSALSSDAAYALYKDKESRIWIGTLNGGINVVDPHKYKFNTIAKDVASNNSLPINYVFCFYEAPNNDVWIGTEGGGLTVWNRKANSFKTYATNKAPESIRNNIVLDLEASSDNGIWIATYGGVTKYDYRQNKFINYKCINPLTGLENQSVSAICEDTQKNVWVSTLKGGGSFGALYHFNRATQKFEAFDTNLSDLWFLQTDKQGRLWSGLLTQLVQIGRVNKNHRFYELGNYLRCVYEDKKGRFWIGTDGGLILFDREQQKIIARYTTEAGLCNNAILSIQEDGNGNLWLSTFNGLSKFDPSIKSFKNYYKSDGLQSNQFHYNAGYKLRSGELLFGGINGFNIFYPEYIKSVSHVPNLVLSGMLVNNSPLEGTSGYVKARSAGQVSAIEVPYNQAVLEFQFTALEYTAPDKIKYAYIMDGWDHNWHYTGNIRTATYTHIDGGIYTFRVKCTNSDGQWMQKEIRIKIHVMPPWYLSWWALLFYSAATISILFIYFRYRARQTKLKYEVSISKINIEREKAEKGRISAELDLERAKYDLEKAEHEQERLLNHKEKEINEKRLSFFTNISHEFRTPLTLIINPAKALVKRKEVTEANLEKEVNVIYRNAKRMLSLVDQLLHFRKVDSSAERLFPTKINFYTLSREVFLCFVEQAAHKQITYKFNCPNNELEVYADKPKLEVILYNLLSNALKYTPVGGTVCLDISDAQDEIILTVADTGSGIKAIEGDNIFEKFYQAGDNSGLIKPGFGIGLYLVKYFAEAHFGQISYQSEVGKGTIFKLILLKGNSHFQNVEAELTNNSLEEILVDVNLSDEVDTIAEATPVNPFETELFTERKSMLVTDDDDEFRKYTADIFSKNFNVYEAASGEEGLNMAKQYLPDIIISDIKMHGISGIDFCKAIKEESATAHIPVILLTGTSSPELKLEGVEGGADDYITKPFDKDYLVARVGSLLKTRNKLQNYFYNQITLNNSDTIKISAEYKEFIEKCIAIVEQYLDDTSFNVTTLQNEIGMSHSNLYRKVKSVSGVSITVFIRLIRLRKAAEMMIRNKYNVNEVGMMVGFNSPNYFRQQFQKLFGMKPSEYIKVYRNSFGEAYSLNNKSFKPFKK